MAGHLRRPRAVRWAALRGGACAGGNDTGRGTGYRDDRRWFRMGSTNNGLVRYHRGIFSRELPGLSITALTATPAGRSASTTTDLYIALNPNDKPIRWTKTEQLYVQGRFQPDIEGKTWFGCGLYLCAWSDADVQAVAAVKWTLHRVPSPVNTQSESGRQLDMADIVAMPDHSIWGRNGPDVLVFANGRTVTHNLPVETFQGVRPGFTLDRRGCLWIPGLQLHVVENGVLEVFRPSGAPLHDVTAVFEDRGGTLWFGLAGKGLAALPDESSLRSWSDGDGIVGSVLDLFRGRACRACGRYQCRSLSIRSGAAAMAGVVRRADSDTRSGGR